MEYVVTVAATLLFTFISLKIINRKQNNKYSKIVYRQSDMHNIFKNFFSEKPQNNKPSQSSKMAEKDIIHVIILDDKAYWVTDNVFYISDVIDENPDLSTAKPIDVDSMSRKELDKMMLILDNLNRGKTNDDSGSRD